MTDIIGTAGADWITVRSGQTYWDGGAGNDMLSFIRQGAGIIARLDLGTFGVTEDLGSRRFEGFERFTGTSFDDVFLTAGDDAGGVFRRFDGPLNEIRGMWGNDWMGATADATLYDGGPEFDTVSYAMADGPVRLSLDYDGWTGFARGDRYVDVEAVEGSAFDDFLVGSFYQDDVIAGGLGNDSIQGLMGDDVIDGGGDYTDPLTGAVVRYTDVAVYGFDANGYTITDLGDGRFEIRTRQADGTDTITGIEVLRFNGLSGNDIHIGGTGTDGADWFLLTSAQSYWSGGAGNDMLSFIREAQGLVVRLDLGTYGTTENLGPRQFDDFERFTGTSVADVFLMEGYDADGVFRRYEGELNHIRAMWGDDWMGATAAATIYDGGVGFDTVSYAMSDGPVRLSWYEGWTGDARGDVYYNVEAFEGSAFDDLLIGSEYYRIGPNGLGFSLTGRALLGGLGNDTLQGNGDIDLIDGGGNRIDPVTGDVTRYTDVALFGFGRAGYTMRDLGEGRLEVDHVGNDGTQILTDIEVLRFAGADVSVGSRAHVATAAAERFEGGLAGLADEVIFENSATGVSASLLRGRGWAGDAVGDRFEGIENLGGSRGNDTLTGDHGDNILRGGEGDDLLIANAGRDILYGGLGQDVAVFSYDRDQYFVGQYSLNHVVSHTGAGEGDGLNTLYGIEILRFADGDVIL